MPLNQYVANFDDGSKQPYEAAVEECTGVSFFGMSFAFLTIALQFDGINKLRKPWRFNNE